MNERRPSPGREDEEVLDLDAQGRDDVAEALAEAERVVFAVSDRQKRVEEEVVPEAEEVPEAVSAISAGPSVDELLRLLAVEREKVAATAEDGARYREALLRKTADFDNLKRRTEKEKADYFRFALADVFDDLLAVLDNFERALQHKTGAKVEDFQAGIEMIARQLAEALKKYGLAETPALGLPFDPNVHEAVLRVETAEVPAGTVLEVLRKGYTLNEKLLRPAGVKVAAAPASRAGAKR